MIYYDTLVKTIETYYQMGVLDTRTCCDFASRSEWIIEEKSTYFIHI